MLIRRKICRYLIRTLSGLLDRFSVILQCCMNNSEVTGHVFTVIHAMRS